MKKLFRLLIVAIVLSVLSNPANCQFWKKKKVEKKEKISEYDKIIKNAKTKTKGIIDMYKYKEELYLDIPLNLLEREFLLGTTISELSDVNAGFIGAKPKYPIMIRFTKLDSNIQIRNAYKEIIADNNSESIQNAINKNSIGSILHNFEIKAFNKEKTRAIIKATDFFISDMKSISPIGRLDLYAMYRMGKSASLKKDKSLLTDIKSFEDNFSVKTLLKFICLIVYNL
jgi:tRNA splicing endonuclease